MTEAPSQKLRVAVIGAGIVGSCISLELLERGHRVTLIEPGQPGGAQSASYGNGAFLSPASTIPMSMPGLWRKLPGYLLDRQGPLTISPRAVPRLLPWLVRFLLAGATMTRVRRTATALHALIHDSVHRHADIALRIGRPELIRADGLLYAYPDRATFEAEATAWSLRRDLGLTWTELGPDEMRASEPALSPGYRFGALVDAGGSCTSPMDYVTAIMDHALTHQMELVQATAEGFAFDGTTLKGVRTSGRLVECDRAVVAAGIGSRGLARQLGDRLPLEAERGYHVEISDPQITLRRPVMPSDGKMANAMISGRFRSSGQVELASPGAAPDWRRSDVLLRHVRRTFPEVHVDSGNVRRWLGNRPSTPDGLPVISASRRNSAIFHACGHGHVGLNAAPATAELIADLIEGRPPNIDPAPYAITRF